MINISNFPDRGQKYPLKGSFDPIKHGTTLLVESCARIRFATEGGSNPPYDLVLITILFVNPALWLVFAGPTGAIK